MDEQQQTLEEQDAPLGICFIGSHDDTRKAFDRILAGESVTLLANRDDYAPIDFIMDTYGVESGVDPCVELGHELKVDQVDARDLADAYVERDRLRDALQRIADKGHVLGWSVAAQWAQEALDG